MYCYLRPPDDSMPLRTGKCWGLEIPTTSRLHFDGCIYDHCAAPPYSAGTVNIMASVYGRRVKMISLFFVIWHSFVEVRTVTAQNKHVLATFLGGEPLKFLACIRKSGSLPTCRKVWLSSVY